MCLCFQNPDPRKMQIMLTGFLNGKNARIFMGELWDLLLSAQASPSGIPKQFLDQKKEELKKKMVIAERNSVYQLFHFSLFFIC